MPAEDHSHAGQGPVLLDIGGPVGALIVHAPTAMAGAEIEIRPSDDRVDWAPNQHVAVIARGPQFQPTAVFPALLEGDYQLSRRPDGPVQLHTTVCGGRVTQANWPEN